MQGKKLSIAEREKRLLSSHIWTKFELTLRLDEFAEIGGEDREVENNRREVMCSRLMSFGDPVNGNLQITLWRPEATVELANGAELDFACAFDIAGLPDGTIHGTGVGVDSLQAVLSAFSGVRSSLGPFFDALTSGNFPHGRLPLVVSINDAGRRKRIEALLDEDEYAESHAGKVLAALRRKTT